MLEIFLTVVAAVIVGAIIVKFWRPILTCTLALVILVIYLVIFIPMLILSFPLRLYWVCASDETLEEHITRTYDKMLHEAYSKEEMSRCQKRIKSILIILKKREEKKRDKQVKNMLEESKWVL